MALSLFDGDLTRLTGITKITLSGLSLSPSGSGGATINNLGGGGGGSTINVQSGSTTISSVSTVRVDATTMTLTNNGGGTVTIGVTGSIGGGGTSGTAGSSGTSLALTIRKGISVISGVQSITLTGSIFLDASGSGGAFLRVDDTGGAPVIFNGVVSSSQQIQNYDTFAVKNSANRFIGNQEITGSLISTTTITAADLYVANAPNFAVPQGNVVVGGSGSRIAFLPTSSLTAAAAINIFDGSGVPFSNINTITFSNDFDVNASGSGAVTILSLSGGGVASSGSGFPFTGSAIITGSLGITGPVVISGSITSTSPITASAFAITSVGVPTIQSATNINLTAGNAVVITSSSLRLASFTDAQTGSLTGQNGDIIYNATSNKFVGYGGGGWLINLSGTSGTNGANGTFFGSSGTSGVSGTFFGSSGTSGVSGTSGITIQTGSFAITGSNTFRGNQTISGSVNISGSITQVGVGANNTFIGQDAGLANTTGFRNTFIGVYSGDSNTTGNYNTFLGFNSGQNSAAGNYNTFIGDSSGVAWKSGLKNTFLGENSGGGLNFAVGSYNTGLGSESGYNLLSGSFNTFVGYRAGQQTTDGERNVAVGMDAGGINLSGSNNVFVGNTAGYLLQSGTDNYFPSASIYIGGSTRSNVANQVNQIVIGYEAIGNGSNTVTIGNSSITATHLRGNTIITGSVNVTEVIRLSAVNPLPVSATAGTLAVSASGAVVKPYFFDGSVWNELY